MSQENNIITIYKPESLRLNNIPIQNYKERNNEIKYQGYIDSIKNRKYKNIITKSKRTQSMGWL